MTLTTTGPSGGSDAGRAGAHSVDLLVLGSGAGGMAAAISARHCGLDTLIVEKSSGFGGSTALSGGAVWVPNNPTLRRAGLADSRESVLEYLTALTRGDVPHARL